MAVICASDDYSKNDTLIDGTSDMMGIRNMFNSIKEAYDGYNGTMSRIYVVFN
jgi:hypothetical protein